MKLLLRSLLTRLVMLDGLIRQGRYPNARSAARELEVSPRTVKRDIGVLRDSWGAPLEFSRERNGYYYGRKDFSLPLVRLTEGELLAFYLSAHVLRQLHGTPYERALERAFEKLTMQLPSEISVEPARLADSLSVAPAVVTPQNAKIFESLESAMRNRRRLELDYWTASRNVVTLRRLVDPYHLRLIGSTWYLFGYCYKRQRVLHFAVPRVRRVRVTAQTFERPEDFDVERYMAGSFRAWRGDGHYRVVLSFPAELAGRAAEKNWHPSQTTQLQPDGSLLLGLELSDLHEVLRWVLSWGAECEVREPEELRTMVREEATRMTALYKPQENAARPGS